MQKPTEAIVAIVVGAEITNNLRAQLSMDLLILQGEANIGVLDPHSKIPNEVLEPLGILRVEGTADLCVVYRTGTEWPEVPESLSGLPLVKRNLYMDPAKIRLDGAEQVGYYLKPQGRNGPSLTDIYLNRTAPQGNGNSNPMITQFWG